MTFYKCSRCGNFVTFLTEKTAATPVCCGVEMTEVVANTTDAAKEKHVPEVSVDGSLVKVQVGSVAHPMMDAHYIQFIILETKNGYQKKDLKPGAEPKAEFVLAQGDEPVAVYEYCNLHGLWKKAL
ncbi:MAG: desulfoferrodoxin family protein [Sphaerochaeta sp.]